MYWDLRESSTKSLCTNSFVPQVQIINWDPTRYFCVGTSTIFQSSDWYWQIFENLTVLQDFLITASHINCALLMKHTKNNSILIKQLFYCQIIDTSKFIQYEYTKTTAPIRPYQRWNRRGELRLSSSVFIDLSGFYLFWDVNEFIHADTVARTATIPNCMITSYFSYILKKIKYNVSE